jgi:hypothetical protein
MSNRLLVAAGEAATLPGQLPPGVQLLIDSADEILVLSPRLPSRLEWLASDTDKSKREADERLRRVLGQLEEMGANVEEATLGADDPVLAFEDAIARFSPNHILVGLRSEDRAGWQESKLLQSLWEKVDVPLTIFDLPDA